MKKLLIIILAFAIFALFTSCSVNETDSAEKVQSAETLNPDDGSISVDNAFYYTHINGNGTETKRVAYVLFEYEQLKTIKYQVAYLACTCRGADVNYFSVAYVELSKTDGSIAFISYDQDSSGHYTAGMYGDSVHTYEGVPAKELFKGFRENVLIGASQETINGTAPMHGEVDTYTGATVTPNNAINMLKSLFKYHNERYAK
ncbi:MAG: FMN-binding protein [Spirochaetia bacterium]|jgi:hypothetical protein|nr:FMN-binding protein [Spirochaetia bacterium]